MKKMLLAVLVALSQGQVAADSLTNSHIEANLPTIDQISIPALIEGNGSEKAQVRQLNHNVRHALGVRHDELIVRLDGTITLYGAEGQGFKVEDVYEDVIPEKGVVNRVAITTVKNSPECNYVIFNGKKYWYPSPDCPH